jgi:hypothetical protein
MRRIDHDFAFHPATEVTGPQHAEVRAILAGIAKHLASITPAGREQSLMLTHLEEAMMWANAAIARHSSSLVATGSQ